MADKLVVFHLKSAGDTSLVMPQGFWHLATCLRSIVFTELDQTPTSLENHEKMEGEKAYEFLLQVICGLDSPLVGETEILGQFKEFYKKHRGQLSCHIQEVIESLNRDAKRIRADYLQNLGCTSYGSLLRKEMRSQQTPMTLIGAGSLAKDILPWFAKTQNLINVFTRNPEKYSDLVGSQDNIGLQGFDQLSEHEGQGVLVIAAPVTKAWLDEKLNLDSFQHIYDLRGDSDKDNLGLSHVTSLNALFANIETNKKQASKIREQAIVAIKEKATHLNLKERQRPFGWEDLWTYA